MTETTTEVPNAQGIIVPADFRAILNRWKTAVPHTAIPQIIAEMLWSFAWSDTPLSAFGVAVPPMVEPQVTALATTWSEKELTGGLLTFDASAAPRVEALYHLSRAIQAEFWELMFLGLVNGATSCGFEPRAEMVARGWGRIAKVALRHSGKPWLIAHPAWWLEATRDVNVTPAREPANRALFSRDPVSREGGWNFPGVEPTVEVYTSSLLPPDRIFVGWKSAYSPHRLPRASVTMFSGFGLRSRRTVDPAPGVPSIPSVYALDTDFTVVVLPDAVASVDVSPLSP